MLMSKGLISCTTCGSTTIRKTLMTPSVATKGHVSETKPDPAPLEKLRQEVEANSQYVGKNFAASARDMHDDAAPEKSIYGEATAADCQALGSQSRLVQADVSTDEGCRKLADAAAQFGRLDILVNNAGTTKHARDPVSYTHLTLPTIYSV